MRRSGLAGGERRRLALILAGRAAERGATALDEEVLRRASGAYGGRLAQLADGSAVVVLEADRQVATDHAARTARCALAVRAAAAGIPMAMAMGRAEAASALPEAEVLERAAQLLAQAAAPGVAPAIALDEVLAGLLDARFDVTETEAGLLLHGERALAQGARTLLGRPTSYVGRDWELGALTGILDECIDESSARAAVVIAGVGMGKSRLCAELVSRIRQRGDDVAIWVGRGDSLRAGSTLDLLAQSLRCALGIQGGEPIAERQDRIRARVAAGLWAGEQRRVTEFLGELVGAPFPDDADGEGGSALRAARQDAQLMSEQMRRAWLDFLQAETAAHPVLLVLEDLHWGDFGTVRFIDMALRERHGHPWMVLALARPELLDVFPRLWSGRQGVQEIRLRGLGRRASERLVHQVLGEDVSSEMVDHLVTRADGNAFYLEEMIRAVAGGKGAAGEAGNLALPETVLAMVETRLAQLAPDARRVLRAASVFGEVCWEGGVAVVLEGAIGAARVAEWIARLIEEEVLVVRPASRFSAERELTFRHALLREGAYATLTDADRTLAHRLVGGWLVERGEVDPMVLAGHFERGGEGALAAGHYLRAAEQAYLAYDLEAALVRASRGLRCAPTAEVRIALLGARCGAAGSLRQIHVMLTDGEEVLRTAPRGSVPWVRGVIARSQGSLAAGQIDELLATLALLREVDPAPEAVGRMAFALVVAISILDMLGRVAEATALEARFTAIIDAAGAREPIARFWWHTGRAMRAAYAHDDPWGGLRHSEAIRAIFDATGGEQLFLNLELFRGLSLWFLGASSAAARTLEAIATVDDSMGMASSLRRVSLAWLYADRGALDEARALASQLAESAAERPSRLEEGRGRWVLAEVLRRSGDLDGADRELARAVALAVPLEQPGVRATLAALRLAQGRPEEALAVAEDAAARCVALGACGMYRGAFVRLTLAEALDAVGARGGARGVIADARARLVAQADRIDSPEYRRSFLEDVPENARTLALAGEWGVACDAPGGSRPAA